MANDDGSHFVAPNLTKVDQRPKPRIICDVCSEHVLTWLALPLENGKTHITAHCHGAEDRIEIDSSHWENLRYESVIQLRMFIQTPQDM